MNLEKATNIVWNILSAMPIEIYDDESGDLWENNTWELVNARSDGDFAGTRAIGSANIITALNMVHHKLLINRLSVNDNNSSSDMSHKMFEEVINSLVKNKKIRKCPEKVRETFRVISNDQT